MKGIISLIGILCFSTVYAQNSDLIILASDTLNFTVLIEGREYKTDGAKNVKITEIPEGALLNTNVILKTENPIAYFGRLEFEGSHEWVYQLVVPKKGNKLELESVSQTKKDDNFKARDLGPNYIVYKYNKYVSPLERVRGTVDASSSLKMKREREKTDTTMMENGKEISEKSERKRIYKESGTTTVIHQERSTTGTGDERETKLLKPRKEDCEGAWDTKTKETELENLAQETSDAGKLYVSKTIAVANCFTAEDAKSFLEVFENESSKIEIVKFIYPSIIDPENLNVLEEYFESPSSWEAVNLYIEIKYE